MTKAERVRFTRVLGVFGSVVLLTLALLRVLPSSADIGLSSSPVFWGKTVTCVTNSGGYCTIQHDFNRTPTTTTVEAISPWYADDNTPMPFQHQVNIATGALVQIKWMDQFGEPYALKSVTFHLQMMANPADIYKPPASPPGGGGGGTGTPTPEPTVVKTTIEDTDTGTTSGKVEYTGGSWTQCTGGPCLTTPNGSYYYGFTVGQTFTVRFTGIQLKVYSPTEPAGGNASVTVDGVAKGSVSFYKDGVGILPPEPVFDTGTLTDGAHTVVFTIAAGTNTVVLFDRADVLAYGPGGSTPPATGPSGATGSWSLAFDDEFSGTALDLTKWQTCPQSYGTSCTPNSGQQQVWNTAQTSNPNITVGGGQLHLTATKSGATVTSGQVATGPNNGTFQSAQYQPFQPTYGFYEVNAKLPSGQGYWPMATMLTDTTTHGAWPGSGEYELYETKGNAPGTVYMTQHDGTSGSTGDAATKVLSPTSSAAFHTYGVDWQADHITWYIDGQRARLSICTQTYADANPGTCNSYRNDAAFKNYGFYLSLQLAVGGTFPGNYDGTTTFPGSADIDWVRYWSLNSGGNPGGGGTSDKPHLSGAGVFDPYDMGAWRGRNLQVWETWNCPGDLNTMQSLCSVDTYFTGAGGAPFNKRWPGKMSLSLYMIPTGGSLGACNAGSYDAAMRNIATSLKNKGFGDAYIRLGWEFNGYWFAENRAYLDPSGWVGCWQRWYNQMKSVTGTAFKFVWNPNFGTNHNGQVGSFDPRSVWPGDNYVDAAGPDFYDWNTAPTEANWVNGNVGIMTWLAFVQSHGKPFASPEWGLNTPNGGGDDGGFIDMMADAFQAAKDSATGLEYESYYNLDGCTFQVRVCNPNATARYLARFGAGSQI